MLSFRHKKQKSKNVADTTFKQQPHKMVQHTPTIRRQQNCLSVFDHFVGLALKGLIGLYLDFFWMRISVRDRHQILPLILSKFKRIINFCSPEIITKPYVFWWFQGKLIRLIFDAKFGDNLLTTSYVTELKNHIPKVLSWFRQLLLSCFSGMLPNI